jgi:hypothetical protein
LISLFLVFISACGGPTKKELALEAAAKNVLGSWIIPKTRLPPRGDPCTFTFLEKGKAQAILVVILAERYESVPAGMYEDATKSNWLIYAGQEPCRIAVPISGRRVDFPVADVSVLPFDIDVSRVSQQSENRVFIETPQCPYHEAFPFSLKSAAAPKSTYRIRTSGIVNLNARYRFTSENDMEVYAAASTSGGPAEFVFARLRLAQDSLTLKGNGTFIAEDREYIRIGGKNR